MASSAAGARLSASSKASGFVLAITLWILTGITIAVALMTLWALDQVGQARIGHEMLEDELALQGTRDTLLYIAATRELNRGGLPTKPMSDDMLAVRRLDEMGSLLRDPLGGELRLDDSPYAGMGGVTFGIQDEAGLFPVVWPRPLDLDRFLLTQGIDREKVPRLRDALLDYIDPDDLTRLNGAERADYEREGLPPPPNRRLLVPGEIARIMGWHELPSEQLARIANYITPYYSGAVNLNTMPAALLPTWVAGCPEICDALVERRREFPFISSMDLQARLATRLPGEAAIDYRYVADETMRFTLWGRTGAAWRMHVRLSPLAEKRGPWSILAAYPIPRPSNDDPANTTGSTLFADPATDRK